MFQLTQYNKRAILPPTIKIMKKLRKKKVSQSCAFECQRVKMKSNPSQTLGLSSTIRDAEVIEESGMEWNSSYLSIYRLILSVSIHKNTSRTSYIAKLHTRFHSIFFVFCVLFVYYCFSHQQQYYIYFLWMNYFRCL